MKQFNQDEIENRIAENFKANTLAMENEMKVKDLESHKISNVHVKSKINLIDPYQSFQSLKSGSGLSIFTKLKKTGNIQNKGI